MRTEWGTTEDSTAEVRGKGRFGIADVDDHAIVVNGPLGASIVVEGTPEQLMKWALDLVASVAKATGQEPDAPAGSTVYTLEWGDKHNQGLSLHATEESAVKEQARIARESWNEISGLDGVPDTAPEDDAEAARIFYDIAEDQGHGTWACIGNQTIEG